VKSIGWTAPAIGLGIVGTALFGLAALCTWNNWVGIWFIPLSPACLALVVWASIVRYRAQKFADTELRAEVNTDHDKVRGLHDLVFRRPNAGQLVDALRASTAEVSIVALAGGWIVGHALFSRVAIGGRPALALAPVAVAPGWQRRGIGTSLVKAGLEECLATGHKIVVALGAPGFYARFGFAPASSLGLASSRDWMVVALVDGALDGVAGSIDGPPAFDEV
jgi:putative acetyltransferase